MKEIVIVAGKNKVNICWLRQCLSGHGYNSVPCKSAEQIIEEMEILPTCDASVLLVIVEPDILSDLNNDLILKLCDFALDVPFLLYTEEEVQTDLLEIFENICEFRTQFRQEQIPELTDILKESGVEVAYSRGNFQWKEQLYNILSIAD